MTEIEWNKCYYIDCLDEKIGLPYLAKLIENGEIEKIDLGFVDPPYNENFKGGGGWDYSMQRDTVFYDDVYEPDEYKYWCYTWFNLLKRICKMIILTPGYKNKQIWFEKEIFEFVIWQNNYRQGSSKIARLNRFELILCYGRLNFFKTSVLPYNYGFNKKYDYKYLVHPCPKPRRLLEWIFENQKPTTVIDPFLGSGTTAEVCKNMDIKWIGYEKEKVYKEDIDMRLDNAFDKNENMLRYYLKR